MIWLHFIGQTKYTYQVYVTFNGKYGWRIVDANKIEFWEKNSNFKN